MVYPAQSFVALAGSEVKKILQVMFTAASNMLLFDDAGQRAVGGVHGWAGCALERSWPAAALLFPANAFWRRRDTIECFRNMQYAAHTLLKCVRAASCFVLRSLHGSGRRQGRPHLGTSSLANKLNIWSTLWTGDDVQVP